MGGNGSHSSGSGTGRDFPPVFSWDWDGKRLIFVGVGRERFENSLPCHSLVGIHMFFELPVWEKSLHSQCPKALAVSTAMCFPCGHSDPTWRSFAMRVLRLVYPRALILLLPRHSKGCNPSVVNSVLLKCRKLRREDQETSDWIVRFFIEKPQADGSCSHRNLLLSHFYRVSL